MKKGIAFLFAAVVMAVAFISCGDEESDPVLKFSDTELTVGSDGGTLLLGVISNMMWNVVSDAEWCVLENYSNSGNGSVIVKVSANVSSKEREAKLTVAGGSLKLEAVVRQSGVNPGNNEELPNESGNGTNTEIEPLDKSLGKLNGKFSVSSTKQVSFSQGNLQYQASTNTWRFAENQYDIIGEDNKNISANYDGWIDLFGWGTSGYNGKFPYMTSTNHYEYGNENSSITDTNYDWGINNPISNGGNKEGMWRTLTADEWKFLYQGRVNAKNLRAQATINGREGYLFLPDSWSAPSNLKIIEDPGNFTSNIYSSLEWRILEDAGAVFLPCAGNRQETTSFGFNVFGWYWSSTYNNDISGKAYDFYFFESGVAPNYYSFRYYGHSVRLVKTN